ncbi:MAG: PASTA domain-containing protein [Casimicrobiaceae bacterium]
MIAQTPLAGAANVALGTSIDLTVSKGPLPVIVPNVVGSAETVARTRFETAGFTVSIARVFSSTQARGVVLSQTPAAGAEVAPGAATGAASLVVSSGNGLALKLDRAAMAADETIVVTPQAFDVNGAAAPVPALSYAITPRLTPFAGSLPTLAGSTIRAGPATPRCLYDHCRCAHCSRRWLLFGAQST